MRFRVSGSVSSSSKHLIYSNIWDCTSHASSVQLMQFVFLFYMKNVDHPTNPPTHPPIISEDMWCWIVYSQSGKITVFQYWKEIAKEGDYSYNSGSGSQHLHTIMPADMHVTWISVCWKVACIFMYRVPDYYYFSSHAWPINGLLAPTFSAVQRHFSFLGGPWCQFPAWNRRSSSPWLIHPLTSPPPPTPISSQHWLLGGLFSWF